METALLILSALTAIGIIMAAGIVYADRKIQPFWHMVAFIFWYVATPVFLIYLIIDDIRNGPYRNGRKHG